MLSGETLPVKAESLYAMLIQRINFLNVCVFVCVCTCVYVRACVRACVCVCVADAAVNIAGRKLFLSVRVTGFLLGERVPFVLTVSHSLFFTFK